MPYISCTKKCLVRDGIVREIKDFFIFFAQLKNGFNLLNHTPVFKNLNNYLLIRSLFYYIQFI